MTTVELDVKRSRHKSQVLTEMNYLASAIQQYKSKFTQRSIMGVRLYPNTKDAAKLEKLAGVPQGTMAQLDILREAEQLYRAAHPEVSSDEAGYSFYCISSGSDVARLDNFLSQGWGKFQSANLLEGEDVYCGEAPVGKLACQLLLNSNGAMPHWDQLDALDIIVQAEGVHWG